MLDFEKMQLNDDTLVYVQIIKFIKAGILSNAASDEEVLPSRRALAMLLGVNPNTIQKAYRMLEEEGVVHTPANSRSILCVNNEIKSKIRNELVYEDGLKFVKSLKRMGVSYKETIEIISDLWDKVYESDNTK